jgi:pyroglutamyl-peptidase
MHVLLTGFEPFGPHASNPSREIVATLAARSSTTSGRGIELQTAVLQTEYDRAARRIVGLIEELRPDAVVSLGISSKADGICLERIALNLNDAELADNSGEVRLAQPIVEAGPMVYFSTLPLDRMLNALRRASFPAAISNHAGTYVCNHVFYTARHLLEESKRATACGFIHVPAAENIKAISVPRLADGIQLVLESLVGDQGA